MSPSEPIWKRVVGGLLGIGILVGAVIYFKSRGATGEQVQEWQGTIVYAAAAAFILVLILKRRGE